MKRLLWLIPIVCLLWDHPARAQTACNNTVFGTFTCIESVKTAGASCTSSSGCTATLSTSVTAGNHLFTCWYSGGIGASTITTTSSPSNTFVDTFGGQFHGVSANGGTVQCWTVASAASGATSVTMKPSVTQNGSVFLAQIAGVSTVTPVRDFNHGAATSTAWDSSSIAAALNGDLCIGIGIGGLSNAPTAGTGYTLLHNQASWGGAEMKACSGADNATMTSNNNPWVMAGIALEPATVPGAVLGPKMRFGSNLVVGP